MTNQIEITTVKGAAIKLVASDAGSVDAYVNGKMHTAMSASLGYDKDVGDHIALAAKVKAQVKGEDVPALRAFFTAAKAASDAYYREITNAEFAARISDKMYGRYSDY